MPTRARLIALAIEHGDAGARRDRVVERVATTVGQPGVTAIGTRSTASALVAGSHRHPDLDVDRRAGGRVALVHVAREQHEGSSATTPDDPNFLVLVGESFAASGAADSAREWYRRAHRA